MNTKAKHTAGPWMESTDGMDVENAHGAGVCALYADESVKANARLIASAPDLLARLEEVTDMYEAAMGGKYDDPDEAEVIDNARAAIAKAKGAV